MNNCLIHVVGFEVNYRILSGTLLKYLNNVYSLNFIFLPVVKFNDQCILANIANRTRFEPEHYMEQNFKRGAAGTDLSSLEELDYTELYVALYIVRRP